MGQAVEMIPTSHTRSVEDSIRDRRQALCAAARCRRMGMSQELFLDYVAGCYFADLETQVVFENVLAAGELEHIVALVWGSLSWAGEQ